MELYQKIQNQPFIILGPCAIESEEILMTVAQEVKRLESLYPNFTFIFKSSFDKANRTSLSGYRGLGMEQGLALLKKVKEQFNLAILTDIHEANQVAIVADIVDIVQIPAFLCRQTDLLQAVGKTGTIVNVKKAQFLSAQDMEHVLGKIEATGNKKILLTERGTMFGYNNLVVDYTGVLDMMNYGYPVVMDATHAIQKPGGAKGKSGGNRFYAPYMAQAAAAIGVRGFFMETHPHPDQALCDGPNMIELSRMENLVYNLEKLIELDLRTID